MNKAQVYFTRILLSLAIASLALPLVSFVSTPKVQAAAGINRTINFQGKLVNNPAKTNVTDTSYTIVFSIYDLSSGGTALWTESQSVTTADGIFRVTLGSVTPFPASFNWNWDGRYLGVKVNSDSEMTPRVQLTAVPYAFNAEKVSGLTVQDDAGNASTSATLRIANAKTVTISNGLTFAGTDSTTITFQGTDTYVGRTTTDTLTNKTIGSTGLTFSGASTDITTASNEDFTLTPNGTGNLTITGDFDTQVLIGASGATTEFPLLVKSGIGSNAVAAFDQLNTADIITASASGTTKFVVDVNGQLKLVGGQTSDIDTLTATTLKIGASTANALTIGNNTVSTMTFNVDSAGPGHFVFQKEGAAYQCSGTDKLTLNSSGQLVCSADQTGGGGGTNWWDEVSGNGVTTGGYLAPFNKTTDLLLGSTATTSAKFGFLNVLTGTPTASISGNSGTKALSLAGTGAIQTSQNNSLTIGGDSTGNISISPNNGGAGSVLTLNSISQTWTGTTAITASSLATLTTAAAFTINGSSYVRIGDTASPGTATGDDDFFVESDIELDGNLYVDGGNIDSVTSLAIGSAGTGTITLPSSGDDIAIAGDTDTSGHAALGGSAAISATNVLNIAETLNPSADTRRGIQNIITSDTSFASGALYGFLSRGIGSHSSGTSNWIAGMNTQGQLTGAGTVTDLIGNYATVEVNDATTGTATSAYALRASITATDGTITTGYGLRVDAASNNSGTGVITNNYGLYVVDQTAGATTDVGLYIAGSDTYAIQVAADDVVFMDNTWIGATAETIASGSYAVDGDDLFVNGQVGVEGTIFTDTSLDVASTILDINSLDFVGAGSVTSTGSNTLTLDSGSNTLTIASSDTTLTASGLANITSAATLTFSGDIAITGNDITNTTLNFGNGSAATLGTTSNANLNIAPNGTGRIGLNAASPLAGVDIRSTFNTLAVASVSGTTPFAALLIDQRGTGDILTASTGGVARFSLTSAGGIKLGLQEGSSGECIKSGGAGVGASWGTCGGASLFTDDTGFTYLTDTAEDFVLGATTIANATFYVDVSAGVTYLGKNNTGGGGTNGGLTFYSSGSGIADPTITADASGNLTISASEAGSSVIVGDGTGNIELTLTGAAADVLIADKTFAIAAAYTADDFTFKRVLTSDAGGENQGGSVLYVADLSTGLGGTTVNGTLIKGNVDLTTSTFTGNLLDLQVESSTKFKVDYTGGLTFTSVTTDIATASNQDLTVSVGTGALVVTDGSGNTFTFDTDAGPTYAGTARPTKTLTLSPEFAGAVLTASGSGTTTGSMTSDASHSASFRTYYQWSSTETAIQDYTVAVRVTLPADFSDWATGNTMTISYQNASAVGATNKVDVYIYNPGDDANIPVYFSTANNSSSWTTINLTSTQLDNGDSPDWDAAGETVIIYLKMYASGTVNETRVGDIVVNYKAKF